MILLLNFGSSIDNTAKILKIINNYNNNNKIYYQKSLSYSNLLVTSLLASTLPLIHCKQPPGPLVSHLLQVS